MRIASAIAIQTVWRKMKQYRRRSLKNVKPDDQLVSKEVLLTLETLKQVRIAPVDFEQDFAARVESKMWEMNAFWRLITSMRPPEIPNLVVFGM